MLQSKKCGECGTELFGRLDKKFCSDQCRAAYNNRHKKPHEDYMQKYNAQLRKNRTILRSLCPTGKAMVRKEVLDEMGFDFTSLSTIYPTEKGMYFFSYEYGFMPVIERSTLTGELLKKVLIIQKQDFANKGLDPWSFVKS